MEKEKKNKAKLEPNPNVSCIVDAKDKKGKYRLSSEKRMKEKVSHHRCL